MQSPAETLTLKSGSCRDSAWLLVQVLGGSASRRGSSPLPAPVVPDTTAVDGPAGASADFTDLHAWAEVYLPGAAGSAWTRPPASSPARATFPLAATPHYRSAAPISGPLEPAETQFDFAMSVTPRRRDAPGDEALRRGRLDGDGPAREKVDADLAKQDVRLTMGGEPTFVSIDDFEAAVVNIAAVGPTKRGARRPADRRLRDRFGPGGLLHYGQGKWYPGESLPRWAFALYWRKDGKPVWTTPP